MTDYLDEYGDDVESIENNLKHALELLKELRGYLNRGLALKASYEVFEASSIVRLAESNIRSLFDSLQWEAKQ